MLYIPIITLMIMIYFLQFESFLTLIWFVLFSLFCSFFPNILCNFFGLVLVSVVGKICHISFTKITFSFFSYFCAILCSTDYAKRALLFDTTFYDGIWITFISYLYHIYRVFLIYNVKYATDCCPYIICVWATICCIFDVINRKHAMYIFCDRFHHKRWRGRLADYRERMQISTPMR